MKSYRIRQMEQYILEHDLVSMNELQDVFKISMNTVRLDVAQLVKEGSVRKVYGGVASNQKGSLVPFEERQSRNTQEKKLVGKAAAALVNDGDIIYIDSGTTTMYVIDFLDKHQNVTVITNSLDVIVRAQPITSINLIVLPGTLERKTNSFVSADTVRALEKYNIDKAFMAASGISQNGMITNSSPNEYEIKKAALKSGREVILLIDSSKYGKSAMLNYANITELDMIVVNRNVDSGLNELCKKNNVLVVAAQAASGV